jgi:hypothetical protein
MTLNIYPIAPPSGTTYPNGTTSVDIWASGGYCGSDVVQITTHNGCTASGLNTATITGKVIKGSGTCWFYWNKNSDSGRAK